MRSSRLLDVMVSLPAYIFALVQSSRRISCPVPLECHAIHFMNAPQWRQLYSALHKPWFAAFRLRQCGHFIGNLAET
jgi:hypothetical protein